MYRVLIKILGRNVFVQGTALRKITLPPVDYSILKCSINHHVCWVKYRRLELHEV